MFGGAFAASQLRIHVRSFVDDENRTLLKLHPQFWAIGADGEQTLEVGIRNVAALLEIPDPTKPAERNWGVLLKEIKSKIDERYPTKERMPGSDGASFEKLYASLDAVKNPWRNGTMHVESFYSDSEATHIMRCVAVFMQQLAAIYKPDEVIAPEVPASALPQSSA